MTRACLSLVLAFAVVLPVRAQDELQLMREPTTYTNAIDAFDEGDPFDLNITAGFRRIRTSGTIQREPGPMPASGRGSANWTDIGDWEHVRNELLLGLDIGIFRDVMIYAQLPLVLSDTREIVYPGNPPAATVDSNLTEPITGGGAPQLFYMPFQSPTRSGIDTLNVGLGFDVLNQHRRPAFPTWMMLFELRLGIGSMLRPCEKNGVERDPNTGVPLVGTDGNQVPRECSTGVSRGTHAFRFETRMSHRYRYAEVYSGLLFHFEWAGRAKRQFEPGGNLAGYQNVRPPVQGTFTAGVALIPWENRETWQRFSIDLRLRGTYVSEGRDYSPLYDAFGSSQHPTLTTDNLEGNPMGPDPGALRRVPFTGLTDVQAHGRIGGQVAVEMQAARYVRFRFGVNLEYITAYILTFADGCNPNAKADGAGDPRACDPGNPDDGLINPHHRPAIDRPGNRFRLDGALNLGLSFGATAQF